jgi:UDP-perosamine 4-acetyltransferase
MPLYLLGGGGHARVVLDALRAAGLDVDAIVDPEKAGSSAFGLPVLRGNPNEGRFLVTVGQIRATPTRERIWSEAIAAGLRAAEAFVDRTALVPATDVQVGEGSIVLAGALLGVGTRVGVNCIVNHRALIEHDCVVGDHAHVSPGAILGGSVRIGRRSHVGIGAVIRQGITIGDDATVGAGAVVVDDVENGATVVGVPARPLART